jgi:DNA-binding winged helix-turn-helix (wHTH) protein
MPKTLRLADGGYMRRHDVHNIIQSLYTMQCVQVIGFSNVGKSDLMRLLAQPDVWVQELGEAGHDTLAVYIDCNRMLDLNEQGFYELVLRCLQESSPALAALPDLTAAYETLVTPVSEFQIPHSFNRGLTAALHGTTNRLVLLFDEFDEPYAQIDSRIFLNLRALRDRYTAKLAYVTATAQPLRARSASPHTAEFCELFTQRTWYLAPLTRSDVERLVHRYADAYEAEFAPADIDFIYVWAGGHPTMVEGICQILDAAIGQSGADMGHSVERWTLHQSVVRQVRADENLNLECTKIWDGCSGEEQTELTALFTTDYQPNQPVLTGLTRKHLVSRVEGRYQIFCRLLAEYIQRRAAQSRIPPQSSSLWVDIDSGEVLVGGNRVETLTNLEYRLMLLLFQNADRIVDKYQIVVHVWGDSYIDEVDDARVEKLVSRLRQKIEPDPANPRFLTTVRGRGYRLVLNHN